MSSSGLNGRDELGWSSRQPRPRQGWWHSAAVNHGIQLPRSRRPWPRGARCDAASSSSGVRRRTHRGWQLLQQLEYVTAAVAVSTGEGHELSGLAHDKAALGRPHHGHTSATAESSSPSSRNMCMARRTVFLLTPRMAATSLAKGRRSPGAASPSAMAFRISAATWSCKATSPVQIRADRPKIPGQGLRILRPWRVRCRWHANGVEIVASGLGSGAEVLEPPCVIWLRRGVRSACVDPRRGH